MPELTPAEEFRIEFDAQVEARFKTGFLGQTVERSSVPSMLRNIIIGVLHELHKIGKLPKVPTSSSFAGQTALQHFRTLASLVSVIVTDAGVVKFDSRALATYLFSSTPYSPPTQQDVLLPALSPSPNKTFEQNVEEMAKALASQLKQMDQQFDPYGLPPESPVLKEQPLQEESRPLQFGRKLNLEDE